MKFNLRAALTAFTSSVALIMFAAMIAAACLENFGIAVACGALMPVMVFFAVGLGADDDDFDDDLDDLDEYDEEAKE